MNTFTFSEKRKKNHIKSILSFYLSSLSYFDFASFELLQNLQEIYSLQKGVSKIKYIDLLIFSCFCIQKKKFLFHTYLKKFFKEFFAQSLETEKKISFFEKISLKKTISFWKGSIGNELDFFVEKSFLGNFTKQVNPVITSEKLVLGLIERNPLTFKNVLQIIFKKTSQWHIFRYKLLRHLYFQEISFHKNIKKNYYQYLYLFQKYNKKKKIAKKLEKKKKKFSFSNIKDFWKAIFVRKKIGLKMLLTNKSVLSFRTALINSLLKSNFQLVLEDEILLNKQKKLKRNYQ